MTLRGKGSTIQEFYTDALPQHDAVGHGSEQVLGVRVDGYHVLAVGILLQRRVDVVGEGEALLLCSAHSNVTAPLSSTPPLAAPHSPEMECCVPSLEISLVPPMATMPSFLLRALRNVCARSSFTSWKI